MDGGLGMKIMGNLTKQTSVKCKITGSLGVCYISSWNESLRLWPFPSRTGLPNKKTNSICRYNRPLTGVHYIGEVLININELSL